MTDLKPNAELAWRVLDHIDAHPESWKQSTWQCGTVACFAGWAVRLSGGTLLNVKGTSWDVVVESGLPELAGVDVEEAAETLLGLPVGDFSREDGEHLFDPENDREDLGRIVTEVFGPRPTAGA